MTRFLPRLLALSSIALAAVPVRPAAAQAIPTPSPTEAPASALGASAVPAAPVSSCLKKDRPAPSGIGATPVTWNDFVIEGELRDPPATVRALFLPVMSRRSSLTEAARLDVLTTAARYRYHVVELGTRETAKGTSAVLRLAPLPLVRKVHVDIKQSPFTTLIDDLVRRRMRIRTGTYLPWDPAERTCELDEERRHIADYLHFEEGYFDARVEHREVVRGGGLEVTVRIELGDEYTTGVVRVENAEALSRTIDQREIVKQFQHDTCVFCISEARFTRARHLDDIKRVVELFQNRGFPAVRVHTSFEQAPQAAFNRRTRTVDFTVSIDPRRRLEVEFVGHDPDAVSEAALRGQLTFNAAASSDDVEANNSARALVDYLQSRGWFDAHVTWTRDRRNPRDPALSFDRITFRLELGKRRPVRRISFSGNRAFSDGALEDELGTTQQKLSTSLFGGNTNATSAQLDADVRRIEAFYRRAGYRHARVHVEAATDPAALGSAALTAALAAADRGNGLYVRYVIDEGQPTLLSRVEVLLAGGDGALHDDQDRALCKLALAELAELHGAPELATSLDEDHCTASAAALNFREDDAAQTREALKNRLWSRGRPRAEVGYEVVALGPHRVAARYTLANVQPLLIGEVVIRGNFKTRGSIIRGELGLQEGELFTQDALADGARRLRNTALFDAVNITMPDLETTTAGEVNAVVDVVERYDFFSQIDAEAGYSSYNGAFLKLIPSFRNLFGIGVSFDVAGTVGFDLAEYLDTGDTKLRQLGAEATLRFPQWLSRRFSPVEFQTELTAFHRRQDTPRFGVVTTDGATVTLSRTWERKRIGERKGIGRRAARAITTGLHYDFRLRERPIDVLRPIGADDDQTQVPISTRTGSVGLSFEWEQRVDRQGTLSPLAPEAGFRFEAQASLASNYLGGQDTFVKLSAAGSKYWPIGTHLVLRGDLRIDEGIPLRGAVLLPEVERFFAGGDSTVRGYADERLATEIVQVGVPPLSNVQQVRILPAGGNIRVMSSLDAQLQIYKWFATAVFADAGLIANQWGTVTTDDIRPSVGIALFRLVTPFGVFAMERAIPLRLQLGDDPRGRWHISFAARAQF